MKKFILFLLITCSYTAQAQITVYNNAAKNTYYGIGGYSFSQGLFQGGVRPNPDVVSGPSPQNDFSYTVSSTGGLQHVYTYISTLATNKSIRFEFKGNNIRKFGCKATAVNIPTGQATTEPIFFEATTNLGNTANQTTALTEFVGFNVSGNENEYIVSVVASFVNPSTNSIAINNITIGDNTPQNVALNFDGVDDYVSIPSTVGNFATNQNFTVSCWIKPDATQTTQSGNNPDENDIISKWAGLGAGVNNNYPFVIRYLNNTRTTVSERGKILVGQWDGTTFTTLISTTAVNDGQWHHVAFVREGAENDVFKLYIDGNLERISTANVGGVTTNTTLLQFGRRGNNESYFKGEIDEVRIRDTAINQTTIQNERFCKTPNPSILQASYNFSNGVPHDNNAFITQVQDGVSTNHGTLNNFAKTGDASNFVTGQVKYVVGGFISNNGSSWATGFLDLQSALVNNSCNDLFDVYVAKNAVAYRPSLTGDVNASFIIPSGMSIYGGFAGTEKSINQRNRALIQTTNETTLSGDLAPNDILSDFTQNRSDNSKTVVNVAGKSNIILDGFSIRGGFGGNYGGGIEASLSQNIRINQCRIFDNSASFGGGISASSANNLMITQTYLLGNRATFRGHALNFSSDVISRNMTLSNCVIAGHTGDAIYTQAISTLGAGNVNHSYTNCTFVNNGTAFINESNTGITNNFTLKNSIVYGNTTGISVVGFGTTNQNITYSLVQGVTTGTGNLNGNTTNPQFINLPTTRPSTAGDYRLKWCSLAIGAGSNAGISPLDLDRNPRNFNGTADMGAYEFLGNTPSQVNNSSITGTIDVPTYAGGAIQSITSTAKILAPAGKIDFKAPNSITLNPGFEVRGVGQYFQAQIGPNVTCSN